MPKCAKNVCVKCVCFPNVLLRRAQFYSPALRCAVRSNNQCYNDLIRYRRCARLLLSAQRIFIKLYSPPLPAQHCTQHCTVSSATRQHCTQHCTVFNRAWSASEGVCAARSGKLRSAQHCTTVRIAQYPARRVAQENALHVPCDHKARSIKKVHR